MKCQHLVVKTDVEVTIPPDMKIRSLKLGQDNLYHIFIADEAFRVPNERRDPKR